METTTTAPKLTKAQAAAYARTANGGTISLKCTHATALASLRRMGLTVCLPDGHTYKRA